ncbi:MAG: undecaprenyl-diphosphate phosphatase [Desulfobacterales bacterium]|nr:MAG: undecaprenyl-diphosphate phosphatase [Desulfobacterales bacterium]UCD90599.1 MAG: undecaprenyl-diphosphate phosphatase [Desulfobacterales bacterium]
MEPFQAIILGTIQGLTEFLPVSSSGHLVIAQHLFGLKESELYFDISVHLGTLVAVTIYFWKELKAIINAIFKCSVLFFKGESSLGDIYSDTHIKLAVFVIVGSIPTAILGLWLYKVSDRIFSSITIVGSMLVVTGIILFMTGCLLWGTCRIKEEGRSLSSFTIKQAVIVGFVQGLAIIPGVSRSGSTIAVALFLGLNHEAAATYSFLLSIPAILGAGVLILKDISNASAFPIGLLIIGSLTSGVVGYCALTFLMHIVKKGNLHFFAPYCWLVGLMTLIFGL